MSSISNITVIARATAREAMRSSVLISTIVIAVATIIAALFFGLVTIGDQARIVKDFGLFAMSAATVCYASISGASFLDKELSRKTVYNVLSKSVSRWHFIIGKFLGMFCTGALLASVLALAVLLTNLAVDGTFDYLILVGLAYCLLELSIICAAALFFSSIVVTPLLSGLFTLGMFLAGRSAGYLLYFVENGTISGPGAVILKALFWGIPNFAQLNVSNLITFGAAVPAIHFVWSTVYAAGYSVVLLAGACLFFERSDFN